MTYTDYHEHDYYHEREARQERYQGELDRRNRHMPVILDSEGADVPWREEKIEAVVEKPQARIEESDD